MFVYTIHSCQDLSEKVKYILYSIWFDISNTYQYSNTFSCSFYHNWAGHNLEYFCYFITRDLMEHTQKSKAHEMKLVL